MREIRRRDFVIGAGLATAAAVSGSAKNLMAQGGPKADAVFINVKDFGAKGDEKTDDKRR